MNTRCPFLYLCFLYFVNVFYFSVCKIFIFLVKSEELYSLLFYCKWDDYQNFLLCGYLLMYTGMQLIFYMLILYLEILLNLLVLVVFLFLFFPQGTQVDVIKGQNLIFSWDWGVGFPSLSFKVTLKDDKALATWTRWGRRIFQAKFDCNMVCNLGD